MNTCPYCLSPMKEVGEIEFTQWEYNPKVNLPLAGHAVVLRCGNLQCRAEISVVSAPPKIDKSEAST